MSKGTTIKEALGKLEEKQGKKACECEDVPLYGQYPPVEKMDASLSTLSCCKTLRLSTNNIEKIANLNGLKNLCILSLGRNNIKSLTGLEAVGDTLEQLWLSYNQIEKLKGVNVLKKLKVLYMSNNQIKDWAEIQKLNDLPTLTELVIGGNPITESMPEEDWRSEVARRLPKLKKLDGQPIVRPEEDS